MRVLLAALLVMLALPAMVEAQGLFSMESREDGRAWEAVGRLELSGTAFCTGALIAPDLVLTAAHCLYDAATGEKLSTDDIQFLAGWRSGRASAYRRVRRAIAHPDYDFDSPANADRVRVDVALLELQLPIRNTTISPFETAEQPGIGEDVGVVSYAHNRSEAPALQDTCTVMSRQDGMMVLSCSVDFGSSGSPVFLLDGDAPRIVSVISAKAEAEGQPVSLGTSLSGPLATLRQQMMADAVRRPLAAGMRRDTGAKSVKP